MDPESTPTEELHKLEVEEITSCVDSTCVTQINEFAYSTNENSSNETELEDTEAKQVVQRFHPEMFIKNGKFELILKSANNELNTRASRRKYKLAILSFNIEEACVDLITFIPTNPKTRGTFQILIKILRLVTGILRLINFKMEYYIVNALTVVDNYAARRRALLSLKRDQDDLNEDNDEDPKLPQRKRKRAKTKKHRGDSTGEAEADQIQEEEFQLPAEDPLYSREIEEILHDLRNPMLEDEPEEISQTKKHQQSQALMETNLLCKVRELFKEQRDENLMVDAPTVREMDQFAGFDEPFYDENEQPAEDIDDIALDIIRNSRILSETNQHNVELTMIPSPEQTKETRVMDPHGQTPSAPCLPAAQRIVDDAVMDLEPLDMVEKPMYRRRYRSNRRVSMDEEKSFSMSTINANIEEAKKFNHNYLINRARKQRAELNPEKKGLEAIMHCGRKILSRKLEDAVKICSKIPKIESTKVISRCREPDLLGTTDQTVQLRQNDSTLKTDQSSVPIEQPSEVDRNGSTFGPDQSSMPSVNPVLDSFDPSSVNPTLSLLAKSSASEMATVEFKSLLTAPTTKLEAARLFTNLLSLQAKGNVQLVQTQFYGQLEVKLINAEDELTQHEVC